MHWWNEILHIKIRRRVGTTCLLGDHIAQKKIRWLGHVIRMPGNGLFAQDSPRSAPQ